jgi:pyruvate dehydrogenase E1 component alpha subunit
MSGHSAHDAAEYVPKHLFEEWAAKDPILRMESLMLERGWADRKDLDALYASLRQQIDEAIEWAENSPYPDPSELTANVYEAS